MSFFDEGKEFDQSNKPFKMMAYLLMIAFGLALFLLLFKMITLIVSFIKSPELFLKSKSENLGLERQLTSDFNQFGRLLGFNDNFKYVGDEELPVILNLNPDLYNQALAKSQKKWWLELNIDRDWTRLDKIGGWSNLNKIKPVMWRYLLTYQSDSENIKAFDLRTLENIDIFTLEQVVETLSSQDIGIKFSSEINAVELLGVVEDQLYIYVHNALDEGVILYADYGEKIENWQVWSQVKGKLVRVAGYNFLLQGYQDNCSSVYTFDRIIGDEKRLERITTTYNGCVEGERFLGVDSQGRLILAMVNGETRNGANLDILGNYVDLYAVPIADPASKTRLLMSQEMPAGVHQAAFFEGENSGDETIENGVSDNSAQNSDITLGGVQSGNVLIQENGSDENVQVEEIILENYEEINAGWWRKSDQIVLVSEGGVWLLSPGTGILKQISNLMNMYGKPVIRSWEGGNICLEMMDRPDLGAKDKMISVDLETGVPIAGTEVCLRHSESSKPYVAGSFSANNDDENWVRNLELPEDFRLIYGDKLVEPVTESEVEQDVL